MNYTTDTTSRDTVSKRASRLFTETLDLERQFLAYLWVETVTVHDISAVLGLSGDDFVTPGHRFVFNYLCIGAEAGRTPNANEVLRLAREQCVELTKRDLQDIGALFCEPVEEHLVADYGTLIRNASADRTCRRADAVVRDTVEAITRGLELEAKQHASTAIKMRVVA